MSHVLISNKRCTGCHMCELACSAWHEGAFRPSVARLRVEVDPNAGRSRGYTCLQAACKKCAAACPTGAITESGGVVRVDAALCDGCADRPDGPACVAACPTKVIALYPETHKAFKCDLCDGEPQCVLFCQNPEVAAVTLKEEQPHRMRVEAD